MPIISMLKKMLDQQFSIALTTIPSMKEILETVLTTGGVGHETYHDDDHGEEDSCLDNTMIRNVVVEHVMFSVIQ